MRDAAELCRGLLRKARSDRIAMEASLAAQAFDAACFHAQQLSTAFHKYGDNSSGGSGLGVRGSQNKFPNANLPLRVPNPESRTPRNTSPYL